MNADDAEFFSFHSATTNHRRFTNGPLLIANEPLSLPMQESVIVHNNLAWVDENPRTEHKNLAFADFQEWKLRKREMANGERWAADG